MFQSARWIKRMRSTATRRCGQMESRAERPVFPSSYNSNAARRRFDSGHLHNNNLTRLKRGQVQKIKEADTMEKTYKYRIKVEVLGEPDKDSLKVLETVGEGIECNGFVILGDRVEDTVTFIHDMSIDEVAKSIVPDEDLMQAAILAQAYFHTEMAMKEHTLRSVTEMLSKTIMGKEK